MRRHAVTDAHTPASLDQIAMLHVLSMLLSSFARLGAALPFSAAEDPAADSSRPRIAASSHVEFRSERDGRRGGRYGLDAWRTLMNALDAAECALLDVRRIVPMASASHAICDRRVTPNETRRSLVPVLGGRL